MVVCAVPWSVWSGVERRGGKWSGVEWSGVEWSGVECIEIEWSSESQII